MPNIQAGQKVYASHNKIPSYTEVCALCKQMKKKLFQGHGEPKKD